MRIICRNNTKKIAFVQRNYAMNIPYRQKMNERKRFILYSMKWNY